MRRAVDPSENRSSNKPSPRLRDSGIRADEPRAARRSTTTTVRSQSSSSSRVHPLHHLVVQLEVGHKTDHRTGAIIAQERSSLVPGFARTAVFTSQGITSPDRAGVLDAGRAVDEDGVVEDRPGRGSAPSSSRSCGRRTPACGHGSGWTSGRRSRTPRRRHHQRRDGRRHPRMARPRLTTTRLHRTGPALELVRAWRPRRPSRSSGSPVSRRAAVPHRRRTEHLPGRGRRGARGASWDLDGWPSPGERAHRGPRGVRGRAGRGGTDRDGSPRSRRGRRSLLGSRPR